LDFPNEKEFFLDLISDPQQQKMKKMLKNRPD